MDVIEVIKSRRAVRAWTDENITHETLNQVLEAGRWSPSPLNSQPWRFTVVQDKEKIEALCKDAREGAFLRKANVVIVVSGERKVINENDKQNEERIKLIEWLAAHEQYTYSAAIALGYMWLAAWSLNIGPCCVTVDRKSTYELLGIPEEHEIIAGLALGHILGNPVPHREQDRKPLSEIVYYEKYGATEKANEG
jgi:nitroreductase